MCHNATKQKDIKGKRFALDQDYSIAKEMHDLIENEKLVVKVENMCDMAFTTDEKLKICESDFFS